MTKPKIWTNSQVAWLVGNGWTSAEIENLTAVTIEREAKASKSTG